MNFNEASFIESRPKEIANTSLDAEDGLRSCCSKVDDAVGQSSSVRDCTLSRSLKFVCFVVNTQFSFLNRERYWIASVGYKARNNFLTWLSTLRNYVEVGDLDFQVVD